MKVLFIFLLSFISLGARCQMTMSVLGKSFYCEFAKLEGIIILEEKTKDSARFVQLKDSLKLKYINTDLQGNKQFLFPYSFEDSLQVYIEKFTTNGIKIKKIYYKFYKDNNRNEDKRAIEAIENATTTAKILLDAIGYEIKDILNIDDNNNRNEYADWFTSPNEFNEQLQADSNIQSIQMELNPNPIESLSSIRNKIYYSWVTFEIGKK